MNTKNQGREPVYENSLKIAVAREYLTGTLGYGSLGKKHGLDIRTVKHFVSWYRKHYPSPLSAQQPSRQSGEAPAAVQDNVATLSNELKEANLKIAALEMLIATASKELGIDIVKKPGTKQ